MTGSVAPKPNDLKSNWESVCGAGADGDEGLSRNEESHTILMCSMFTASTMLFKREAAE
jgi:hypothetical protein